MELDFPFPLETPTTEDYGDTDVMLLKSYYLDSFKKLLNSFGKQKSFKIFCDGPSLQLLSYLTSDFNIGDKKRIEKWIKLWSFNKILLLFFFNFSFLI